MLFNPLVGSSKFHCQTVVVLPKELLASVNEVVPPTLADELVKRALGNGYIFIFFENVWKQPARVVTVSVTG